MIWYWDRKYNNSKEAAKILASSSRKIDKNECLSNKEELSFDQSAVIEQARFNYTLLVKAFGNHIKTVEDQGNNK